MLCRLIVTGLLCGVLPDAAFCAAGTDTEGKTIALTAEISAETDDVEKDLLNALLVLLEVELPQQANLSIVERRQIHFSLFELALAEALGRESAALPQLGSIVSAELILSARLLEPAVGETDRRVLVTVTESLTAVVRGATVVAMNELTIDEAVLQVTRFVVACIDRPQTANITVSVAPFESLAQFGTIRPLELIIRDVLTSHLLDTSPFQIVQRTNMGALLDELELARSALVDPERLPETLPARHSLYHLRGTVEERYDEQRMIAVNAELVDAVTGAVAVELDFESPQQELVNALQVQSQKIVAYLEQKLEPPDLEGAPISVADGLVEWNSLLEQAMRDVHRFVRRRPYDYAHRSFRIPGYRLPRHLRRPAVETDSPLGDHLLRASVDRLETLLFLHPERRDLAYALAYCYCFHRPGIWNPERAEHLLQNVFHAEPGSELSLAALVLYAEMYVNHEGQMMIQPEHQLAVIEHMRFGLTHIPIDASRQRVETWMRTLSLLHRKRQDYRGWTASLELVAKIAEHPDCPCRRDLALFGSNAALAILRYAPQETFRRGPREVLVRWSIHEYPVLRYYGIRALGSVLRTSNPDIAIEYYLDAAMLPVSSQLQVYAATHAASLLLAQDRPAEALSVLTKHEPADSPFDYVTGVYGATLGECYEDLGRSDDALATYIRYAEDGTNAVSSFDLPRRIQMLGGIPPRDKPDIRVRYVSTDNVPIQATTLATVDDILYCGGLGHPRKLQPGIKAVDLNTGQQIPFRDFPHTVTCLAGSDTWLWVGTEDAGLWRLDTRTGDWTQWSTDQGLPVDRVVELVPHRNSVYVSLGEVTPGGKSVSGGVVHLTDDGKLDILVGSDSLPAAPTSMVVADDALLVVSYNGLYQWHPNQRTWTRPNENRVLAVFPGETDTWVARSRREITQLHASDRQNARFSNAWYPRHLRSATYRPGFLMEQDGQIWLGGRPWRDFKSSGFYRLDTQTGEFHMYGPRDGFRYSSTARYTCYDGLFAANRIWLATSEGLAEVAILLHEQEDRSDELPEAASLPER